MLLSGLALVILASSCGSDPNESVVVVDDRSSEDAEAPFDARAAADGASFRAETDDTARVTPDGVTLDVDAQYFEALRVEGWTAPDECTYDTAVAVEIDDGALRLESPPLDGPTSDDDLQRDGLLGAAIPRTDPLSGEGALLLLVVAFTHDSVVTMTVAEPLETSPYSALDTQPADGWTPLGLLIPTEGHSGSSSVGVDLSYEDEAGGVESVAVELPRIAGDEELSVLTDSWIFDESGVGAQCTPPPGETEPLNRPVPGGTDPLGGIIGDKPTLPDPGEAPEGLPSATAEVLTAIRTVYDIGNVYDEAKADHMENPELARRILQEIRENEIVEPYLGRLDPIFDSVVFTSPTEASVLYQVGPSYHWEIGRVLAIDGSWRVALGTFCRDLSDAIYTCPNVTPDPRPGPLG